MRPRRLAPFVLAVAFPWLAPAAHAQGGSLTALEYHAPVPATWHARPPASSMRVAEFVVGEAADRTEVVVYFFGQGQGGAVDANIARWRGQFASTPAAEAYEKVEDVRGGAFPVTIAEWRGTYARGIGAGGDERPGHTLVAAIVTTPRGTLFFQLFGPSARVAAAREGYLSTVRALR